MQLILNIGLARGDGFHVPVLEALSALRGTGLWPLAFDTVESDTEPTLVLTCEFLANDAGNATPAQAIYQIATKLGQDCIATWAPAHQKGRLDRQRLPNLVR